MDGGNTMEICEGKTRQSDHHHHHPHNHLRFFVSFQIFDLLLDQQTRKRKYLYMQKLIRNRTKKVWNF